MPYTPDIAAIDQEHLLALQEDTGDLGTDYECGISENDGGDPQNIQDIVAHSDNILEAQKLIDCNKKDIHNAVVNLPA
ncbi:hypothetical protein HON22_02775 [Candidatus Peregrinibacteria bacterium]|jgi:hypothetical protein|nr:hypothetical protein [Candidatus Peregrinibacteria bacterium]